MSNGRKLTSAILLGTKVMAHAITCQGWICCVLSSVLLLAAQCGFLKGHGLSATTQADAGTGCDFSWPGDLRGFAYLTLG